jgi:porin
VRYPKLPYLAAAIVVAATTILRPALADDSTAPPAVVTAPGPRLPQQAKTVDQSASAVTVRLLYTGEAADNLAGGLHDGATYMNNVLAQVHVDADTAFGWTGGSFTAEGFYENQDSLDAQYVGAIQDPSVIDTSGVTVFRLYQAYYKQDLADTNLLFGIYDLQTEFGSTRPMDIFFNGAYAWSTTLDQSGLNGPSTYPSTSLAFRVREKLGAHWRVQAAVLDGVPDSAKDLRDTAVNINQNNGALLIAEVDYLPSRTTKIMAGYWDYTGKFPLIYQADLSGPQRQAFGSAGGYIGGATRLYSETARRGLDAFVTVGFGDATRQIVDRSLNAGLTYTGLLDDRPFDKLGIAVGIARAGDAYRQMQTALGNGVETYETNFEMTYRAQINDWLTVQPDVQYWINPGVDPVLKNDLLLMIHFEISHAFNL